MINQNLEKIKEDIKQGKDNSFSYEHFSADNMKDYEIMKWTVGDMMIVYNINEVEAINILDILTH